MKNGDDFEKKSIFTTEHTKITEKIFLFHLFISVGSVLSVVNFQFLRVPQMVIPAICAG
jgi:hypothetical protein